MNSRTLAARILTSVLDQGDTLDQVLPTLAQELDDRDQAFVQELCYGVLRWLPRLRYQLGRLLERPLKSRRLLTVLLNSARPGPASWSTQSCGGPCANGLNSSAVPSHHLPPNTHTRNGY